VNTKEIIASQYRAALEMLRLAIAACPESLWNDQEDKNRFWHVSYHVLFYTHLYLQPSREGFSPWSKHRDQVQNLEAGEPYSRAEILEYHEVVRQEVEEQVALLNLDAESGFHWLPFGKLELQFYNIRHLQHHTGELYDRLGTRENISVDWIGAKSA